jgi:hypothetical protein
MALPVPTVITSTVISIMPTAANVQVDTRSVTMLTIVAIIVTAAAALAAMPPATARNLLCK